MTLQQSQALRSDTKGTSLYRDAMCCMFEDTQMFGDFLRHDLEILAHYANTREVENGELVFNEGDKGKQMYLVVRGSVKILKDSGKETQSLTTVKKGHTMGEMSILDQLPYSASAVAEENTLLVAISQADFELLAKEHPYLEFSILKRIARLISLRLRQTTGSLVDHIA